MIIDEKAILQRIKASAKRYKDELVGKSFLYIYENGYIEILFTKDSFSHLTGVARNISAKNFFDKAVNRQLTTSDYTFDKDHPIDLCYKKIFHLEDLTKFTNSDLFILENVNTQTITYKFGFTDLYFTLCFFKPHIDSNYFIPRSLRIEDCFSKSDNKYEIYAILEKNIESPLYDKINIQVKNNISISDELKTKMSDEVYEKLVR